MCNYGLNKALCVRQSSSGLLVALNLFELLVVIYNTIINTRMDSA
jgi:hypothetical protein